MSTKEKDTLRFGVKNSKNEISSVWRCWISKNSSDIYLAVRSLAGMLKVSLHESGSWQVGFTKEYSEQAMNNGFEMPEIRHMDIWSNSSELSPGIVMAYQIVIPSESIRTPIMGDIESKKVIWIDSPTESELATHISLIITDEGKNIEVPKQALLIGVIELPENKRLHIISCEGEIPKLPSMNGGNLHSLTNRIPELEEIGILRILIPCTMEDGRRFIYDSILDPKSYDKLIDKLKEPR